jgi:hypothetical protein
MPCRATGPGRGVSASHSPHGAASARGPRFWRHTAVDLFPAVIRLLGDPHLATDVADWDAGLDLCRTAVICSTEKRRPTSPMLTVELYACERPIARFAPDSSRKTSRRGSIRSTPRRNDARSAWTVARSCSAGRDRFFEHVSGPLQRAQHTQPTHTPRGRRLAVVRPCPGF